MGGGVEAPVRPWINAGPRAGSAQAEACRALALTTRLALGGWPHRAPVSVRVPPGGHDAAAPNRRWAWCAIVASHWPRR